MPKAPVDNPSTSAKKRGSKASKSPMSVKKHGSKASKSQISATTVGTGDSLTLTDLLSSNIARLPKRYDEDIEQYLAQLFGDYADAVARLATKGPVAMAVGNEMETIRALSDGILSTLDLYLSGRTFEAFQTFSIAIDRVRTWLNDLVLPLVDLLGVPEAKRGFDRYGHLYRLRTGRLVTPRRISFTSPSKSGSWLRLSGIAFLDCQAFT